MTTAILFMRSAVSDARSIVDTPRIVSVIILLTGHVLWAVDVTAQSARLGLGEYDLREESAVSVELPKRLREISGLAVTSGDRVFAHSDEGGIIYEIDPSSGEVVKTFELGDDDGVSADFEGIAVVDDRFFLVTSDGILYEAPEGGDGDRVLFNTYGTGVDRLCKEIEGLMFDPGPRTLLLACKDSRSDDLEGSIAIFGWAVDGRGFEAIPILVIAESPVADAVGTKRFRPTAIERHPRTGNYVLISAPDRAIAEVTPGGELVGVRRLERKLHRQAEGVTFLSDLTLLIADEGGRHGRLTRYRFLQQR